jgi:ClpP class serine protease
MKTHSQLPNIRSALYGTPWAIKSDWLDTICAIYEAHVAGNAPRDFVAKPKANRHCPECKTGILKLEAPKDAVSMFAGQMTCPNCGTVCNEEDLTPYDIIDGVAILPLTGPLFPKANLLTQISGATSYDEFGSMFTEASEDSEVSSLLITADSPGGSCLGLAEVCNTVFNARENGSKPIMSLISPMACSAAYAIVSQCDRVLISESAMAGSIGTLIKYNNWDRAERNEGNDAVMLTSSDIKSFGTPQSLAQYQSLIDTLMTYFGQFKEIVARGRPEVDIEAVSSAKVWGGKEAVNAGLCDAVSTFDEVMSELSVVDA